jgi:hypothetical protein
VPISRTRRCVARRHWRAWHVPHGRPVNGAGPYTTGGGGAWTGGAGCIGREAWPLARPVVRLRVSLGRRGTISRRAVGLLLRRIGGLWRRGHRRRISGVFERLRVNLVLPGGLHREPSKFLRPDAPVGSSGLFSNRPGVADVAAITRWHAAELVASAGPD